MDSTIHRLLPPVALGTLVLLVAAPLPADDLPTALDNPALVFQTGGDVPWIVTTAETADGVDAARTGALTRGQRSVLETTVTGPGRVTFSASVQSDVFNGASFSVNDGQEGLYLRANSHLDPLTFTTHEYFLESGPHNLKWFLDLGQASQVPDPRLILDQVQFDHGYQITTTAHGSAVTSAPAGNNDFHPPGTIVTLTGVPLPGYSPLGWYGDATSTDPAVSLTADANKELSFFASLPLPDAADSPGLTFVRSGDLPWIGQTEYTHDGEDALMSPPLPLTGGTSTLQLTVDGPGLLSFYYKSVGKKPGLRFSFGSTFRSLWPSETEWKFFSTRLPEGPHTIEWHMARGSHTDSIGRVVLDELVFEPGYEVYGGGKFTMDPPGGLYPPGTTVTLTGLPDPGHEVSNWASNPDSDISGATENSVTLTVTAHTQVFLDFRHTLPYALDSPELSWATSPDNPWVGTSTVTFPKVSGGGDGSWIETMVTGPGTLKYDIRCIAPYSTSVSIDGSPRQTHTNHSWETIVLPIPDGQHKVRWTVASPREFSSDVYLNNVLFLGPDALGSWRRSHFGPDPTAEFAGLLGDPDRDHRRNWLELATASDPNHPDQPPPLLVGNELRFRILTGVDAISTILEQSQDLSKWSETALPNTTPIQINGATYLEGPVNRLLPRQFYRQRYLLNR